MSKSIRVVFRLRKAGNLINTGDDNTPHGMTNLETITLRIAFDVNSEETMGEFCNRILKIVVEDGYSTCPELLHMPRHMAMFSRYNIDETFDACNGYRIDPAESAKVYEGCTLVLCYTNHGAELGNRPSRSASMMFEQV